MRFFFIFTISLLPLYLSHASQKFWKEIQNGNSKQFENQIINISGEISYLKKHVRSRDNFFIFHLKDPDGNNYIEVKFFTIKRLKRINTFNCQKGQRFFLTEKIKMVRKGNQIGKLLVDKTNKTFECFDVKIIEIKK